MTATRTSPPKIRVRALAAAFVATTALGAAGTTVPAAEAAVICNVDTRQIPANLTRARRYAAETGTGRCTNAWNRIVFRLVGSRYRPPGAVLVVFTAHPFGGNGAGATVGNRVELNYNYVQAHWTDWGLLTHELTHVVQSYPYPVPWVAEGVADWTRYDANQPPPGHGPSPTCAGGAHYIDGYECAAAFLKYLNRRFDPAVMQDLNAYQHHGGASPSGWLLARTGYTLPALWAACRGQECRGGRANV